MPKSIFTNPTYTSANNNNNVTSSIDYDGIYKILNKYAETYRKGSASQTYSWKDEWYSGCGIEDSGTYILMYNKMLSSVFTNGGFWISRYEIGDSTATNANTTRYYTTAQISANQNITGTPVSKQDQIPYNYVTCSQAQSLANGMTTDSKTSSLLFGIQWDLTCKFLEEKAEWGTTVQTEKITYINSNSTEWGNYNNKALTLNRGKYNTSPNTSGSEWKLYTKETPNYVTNSQTSSNGSYYQLLTTGASDTTKKMNIYDFAGNEYEWTLEHVTSYTSHPCAYMGGYCGNDGSSRPASYRNYNITSNANDYISFRVTLY